MNEFQDKLYQLIVASNDFYGDMALEEIRNSHLSRECQAIISTVDDIVAHYVSKSR